MLRLRRSKVVGLSLLLLAVGFGVLLFAQRNCPDAGSALTHGMREFVRLKNRTTPPRAEEFDERVTLASLLRPGDDRARWSEARAGAVEGYVVGVGPGGVEAANCYSLTNRDTHIYLAPASDAPARSWVVVEVTPRAREWAVSRGADWSEAALRREFLNRRCRVEGWLLFDREHAGESENTAPGGEGNWRGTAWELHPVTRIEVVR